MAGIVPSMEEVQKPYYPSQHVETWGDSNTADEVNNLGESDRDAKGKGKGKGDGKGKGKGKG